MNTNDLYLQDIEKLKKIQPIMERLGIEPDTVLENLVIDRIGIDEDTGTEFAIAGDSVSVSSYRSDKLELALPDWCFGWTLSAIKYLNSPNWNSEPNWEPWTPKPRIEYRKGSPMVFHEFDYKDPSWEIQELLKTIWSSYGQAKLNALADLLILLEKNGLGRGGL